MSVDLISAALWLDLTPARKLVLVALCDRADLITGKCWPGREYIAARTSLSLKSVTDHLAALEADGWVKSKRGNRRLGQTTMRWVNVERLTREGRERADTFKDGQLARLSDVPSPDPEQLALGEPDDGLGEDQVIDQVKLTDGLGEAASLIYVSDTYDHSSEDPSSRESVGTSTREGAVRSTDVAREAPTTARAAPSISSVLERRQRARR